MKNLYKLLSKALIVMLVTIIPLVSLAQVTTTTTKKEDPKATKEQPKKVNNQAPSHNYWGITLFGS